MLRPGKIDSDQHFPVAQSDGPLDTNGAPKLALVEIDIELRRIKSLVQCHTLLKAPHRKV